MEENKGFSARLIVGGLLIVIGLLLFMSINDYIDYNIGHIIFSFPFILFVIGILILVNSRNRTFGLILTFVGLFFLIPRIFPWIDINGSLIFPLLIIGLGIAIIVRQRGTPKSKYTAEGIRKDFIDDVAVFGGGQKVVSSDNFRGGNVTAIFGGSEIDLSGSKLAEGENVLDVLMIFGGTDITVPKEWNIIVNVTPIFGGFSNKVLRDPSMPIDKTRTLVIKGLTLFGGGEVKNKF